MVCCAGTYILIMFIIGVIAAGDMAIEENFYGDPQRETRREKIESLYDYQNSTPQVLLRSWARKPFVDVQAYDSEEF